MTTSLPEEIITKITSPLERSLDHLAQIFPGETGRRQPVHTVYGGAHLFRSDAAARLGQLAVRAFELFADDPDSFGQILGIHSHIRHNVYERIKQKLAGAAVEDFRIDFEDGYGLRAPDEEDGHAELAAKEVAKGLAEQTLPPYIGIRIKPLSQELMKRSIRTMDIFLTKLLMATGGRLPDNFVVTLPKVVAPEQVRVANGLFCEVENRLGLPEGALRLEIMVETTQAIFAPDGMVALPMMLSAANGRCVGFHFGAYDYAASCAITAASQDFLHPSNGFARHVMQAALAGRGVWLSDGATNILPIPVHRGEDLTERELDENRKVIHRAWKLHYDHCRSSLANGFYQGWDLHPAQLSTRYAAVYAFFLEGLDAASERLCAFLDRATQATLVGDVFDDAATGQGLLNYFLRAIYCGAISEQEVAESTGLTLDDLHARSFTEILKSRKSPIQVSD